MSDKKEVGLYIGDELITTLQDREFVGCTTKESADFNRFQLYLKRKNKFFMRDKVGNKLSFEVEGSDNEYVKELKVGDWYTCEFSIEPEKN